MRHAHLSVVLSQEAIRTSVAPPGGIAPQCISRSANTPASRHPWLRRQSHPGPGEGRTRGAQSNNSKVMQSCPPYKVVTYRLMGCVLVLSDFDREAS